MYKTLILLSISCLALTAAPVSFGDVELVHRSNPSDNPKKADGMLHLDREARVLSFSSDNRVLANVRYEWVKSATYERRNDHLLTIQFRDDGGQGRFAQLYLKGGNRDSILAAIEAHTGVRIERVDGR